MECIESSISDTDDESITRCPICNHLQYKSCLYCLKTIICNDPLCKWCLLHRFDNLPVSLFTIGIDNSIYSMYSKTRINFRCPKCYKQKTYRICDVTYGFCCFVSMT